jgi:hypothetical protein
MLKRLDKSLERSIQSRWQRKALARGARAAAVGAVAVLALIVGTNVLVWPLTVAHDPRTVGTLLATGLGIALLWYLTAARD